MECAKKNRSHWMGRINYELVCRTYNDNGSSDWDYFILNEDGKWFHRLDIVHPYREANPWNGSR